MALIPSLSLWSSIKIPFSQYSNKKTTPTVPRVGSCKHLKQRHYRTHRGCSAKSKTKQIGYVIVPGGASLDESNDWEETFGKRRTAGRYCEDSYDKCQEFNLEKICGECAYVPSVTPWMQELDEIDRKHHSLEPKAVKVTEEKKQENKQKENILLHRKNMDNASGSSNEKELEVYTELHLKCLKNPAKKLQALTAKMKGTSTDADYYERKIAELYAIELGNKT